MKMWEAQEREDLRLYGRPCLHQIDRQGICQHCGHDVAVEEGWVWRDGDWHQVDTWTAYLDRHAPVGRVAWCEVCAGYHGPEDCPEE